MDNKITNQRNVNFWYFDSKHTEEYKEKVINYLKSKEEELSFKNFSALIINLHGMNKRENPNPTGHIFATELPGEKKQLRGLYDFLLSKDRMIKPLGVLCNKKADYQLIKDILKENYGEEGKLVNYWVVYGRTIKVPKRKQIKTLASI